MDWAKRWNATWKIGEARGRAKPVEAGAPSAGEQWGELTGAEKVKYLGAQLGLASAALPLAALAVASWPLSAPMLWMAHRAEGQTGGKSLPPVVAKIGMLAVAPTLTQVGYQSLAQWRSERAAEGKKARAIARMPPADRELIQAAIDQNVGAIKKALEAGANPDAKTHYGEPALCVVSIKGCYGGVRELLAAKANPNAENVVGISALALSAKTGSMACAQALLDAGARLEMSSGEGFESYAKKSVSPGWIAGVKQYAALKGDTAAIEAKQRSNEMASLLRGGASMVGPGSRRI